MSETNKRLVRYHIGRLKDKDPKLRMAAIDELKHLNDLEALEPLQDLFKSDPDVDVRKAAQEAGRVIWTNHQSE